jgi:hypothetical protein
MLRSPREFEFSSKSVLDFDIRMRESVVASAKAAPYGFGTEYSGPEGSSEGVLAGGDYASELSKWFDPAAKDYAIGCWVGADIAYLRGIHAGVNPENLKPFRTKYNALFSSRTINDMAKSVSRFWGHSQEEDKKHIDDWVPGEMGYIRNAVEKYSPGQAGQNIIYLGGSYNTGDKFKTFSGPDAGFWGLGQGVKSLQGMYDAVNGWNKAAIYTTKRQWANTAAIYKAINQ